MVKEFISEHLIDVGKTTIAGLMAIIIAMAGFWLMIGKDYTTRAEVDSAISKEVDTIRPQVIKLNNTLDGLRGTISDLRVELVKINKNDELRREIEDCRDNIEEVRARLRELERE